MRLPKLQSLKIHLGVYRHYKGKEYDVLGVARHSETFEPLVMYRARYDTRSLWVRPRKMFEGYLRVKGKRVKRFTFVGGPKNRG
ncbi:MAG: DUF1653 domain-containing protein [bacterium]|nr:DUF1653 domain-containing protein [bacterium]